MAWRKKWGNPIRKYHLKLALEKALENGIQNEVVKSNKIMHLNAYHCNLALCNFHCPLSLEPRSLPQAPCISLIVAGIFPLAPRRFLARCCLFVHICTFCLGAKRFHRCHLEPQIVRLPLTP